MTSLTIASPASLEGALINCWLPRLLVMMTTVLVKSTTRPCPSVSRPSSSSCKRTLKTSGWAFSISSKRITE